MPRCEFCGKNKKTANTAFTGSYCKQCFEIVIDQCREAIKELTGGK